MLETLIRSRRVVSKSSIGGKAVQKFSTTGANIRPDWNDVPTKDAPPLDFERLPGILGHDFGRKGRLPDVATTC